jgi:outer membrane receptor protein involved in Fe transport
LFGSYSFKDKTSLAVLDAVFNGETGLALPGGKIAWAGGFQYREDGIEREFNDDTNVAVNPCADTPVNGNTSCTTMAGPLAFLGTLREIDLSGDVYGVFAELSLPLFESLQAQVAYTRDRLFVEGIEIENAGGRDFAGTRGSFNVLPELRGSVYLDWSTQSQNLRLTTRYIDGVTDLRSTVADPDTGKLFEVGSFLTHDLVYRVALPSQTTLTAAVINFTDRDPPFARLELNYDPFVANPIGRSVKLALNKRF